MPETTPKEKNDETPVVAKGVTKSFGSQHVLQGVDLEVKRKETVAVLGQSGTGKSVFLRLLIGLHQPDSGSIVVFGEDISKLPLAKLNDLRKRIGFLFQHSALYDSMSVEENVAFPLRRHTKLSDQERDQKVRDLLKSVGMEADLKKMPSELSGGMQRRVGLARALALDPELLLFDEPTAGLDPIMSAEIGKLISQQKQERNVTSIVVTHDIHNAKSFADRLVVLHDGKIVSQGTYQELERSQDEFVARYLRDAA
ncbi:MAG TPA: ABC transporter ATP-binding protein [Bryobacteraceae bacterium]|jgi:phospholipid/cholesterol/gamma-HCH transport system ATP-binding protein|nr:ABC transporter ATP-binding protein [Bryobacteraceae bacterium]